MALGISGSNGGIGRVYKRVIVADVEAGIAKYESLLRSLPSDQEKTRTLYGGAIKELKRLKERIESGELEEVLQG